MSAADRREELEAAIWQRVTPGLHEHGKGASRRAVDAILAAADGYAETVAGERLARMTSQQLARLAEIRRRGEQATAEAFPAGGAR